MLEHPALTMVEFSMVPDGPWKNEAQKRVTSGKLSLAVRDASPTMQFVSTGLVRSLEPRPYLNLSREETGGTGVAVAAAAALGVGAVALFRRRRRRRR